MIETESDGRLRVEPDEFTDAERQDTISQLIKAMEETGMPSEYVYAAKKTGNIVLEDNLDSFTSAQLDEWNEAVEEGRRISRRLWERTEGSSH